MRYLPLILMFILCLACARSPLKDRKQAMRPVKELPDIVDDQPIETLLKGLEQNIQFFRNHINPPQELVFGPRIVKLEDYLNALEFAVKELKGGADPAQYLKENFEFYEVYGRDGWSEVFITSYYHPVISGTLKPTDHLSQALYKVPKDLVAIKIGEYATRFPTISALQEITEQKSKDPVLRGRLIKSTEEASVPTIVPYFSREEIDGQGVLKDKELEIVYVDPIEAFFLHIQGSGTVELENKKRIHVNYGAQNGHPYYAIGKSLTHVIELEQMTLQRIEAYLRSVSPEERQTIFNQNQSYIFFAENEKVGTTYLGTEAVPGRTIATDNRFFPKGTLAYLIYEKPVFDSLDSIDPKEYVTSGRFVLDQDTGGAIRYGGRVDLYWGEGPEAKQAAGVVKHSGRLYYLLPKISQSTQAQRLN